MHIIRKILLGSVLVLLVLAGIGFLLPSQYRVERSIDIAAKPQVIFAELADLRQWQSWSVWYQRDASMLVEFSGEPGQTGQLSRWQSASQGNGEMQIILVDAPKRLLYQLRFEGFDMASTGEFTLIEHEGRTQVVWADYGDLGNNPVNHYLGLVMDSIIGPDFEASLRGLKQQVEK